MLWMEMKAGRWASFGQFLEDDRRLQPRQVRPAHVLAHVKPAEAKLGRLDDHVAREDVFGIPFGRMWRHLAGGKRGGEFANGGLFFSGFEVHPGIPPGGEHCVWP